jgi:hypothetical protein
MQYGRSRAAVFISNTELEKSRSGHFDGDKGQQKHQHRAHQRQDDGHGGDYFFNWVSGLVFVAGRVVGHGVSLGLLVSIIAKFYPSPPGMGAGPRLSLFFICTQPSAADDQNTGQRDSPGQSTATHDNQKNR